MKKQRLIRLEHILFLPLLIVFAVFGCKKEEKSNSNVPGDQNEFIITVNQDKLKGWFVINSADGTQVIDYKSFDGISAINFGDELPLPITVSAIFKYESIYMGDTMVDYEVITFHKIIPTSWLFSNDTYPQFVDTNINITVTYPPGDYNSYKISYCAGSSSGSGTHFNSPPQDTINYQVHLYNAPENDKLSLFAAVFGDNVGLSGFSLNQDFNNLLANGYNLPLNYNLEKATIWVNTNVRELRIYGTFNDNNEQIEFWYSSTPTGLTANSFDVFYCNDNVFDGFRITTSSYNDEMNFEFEKYYSFQDGIPENLSIPEIEVSGNPSANGIVRNVDVTGSPDFIASICEYSYNGNSKASNLYWINATHPEVDQIKPTLFPQEIIDEMELQMGNLNANLLVAGEFDQIYSLSEYVDYIMGGKSVEKDLNSSYFYYRPFNQNKSSGQRAIEKFKRYHSNFQ